MLPSSKHLTVLEYVREDGSVPFARWFHQLSPHAAARVATAIARLEMGNTSSLKWLGGIGEYRINWGPGYRLYLGKDGDKVIVLLGGGTKQRQNNDISRAKILWDEYTSRKAAKGKGKTWR